MHKVFDLYLVPGGVDTPYIVFMFCSTNDCSHDFIYIHIIQLTIAVMTFELTIAVMTLYSIHIEVMREGFRPLPSLYYHL